MYQEQNRNNECRRILREVAKKKGICTQCFSRWAMKDRVQCLYCINLNRTKKGYKPLKGGEVNDTEGSNHCVSTET